MITIGTQIYGLASQLAEDFEGTIRSLRRMGFDAIEPLVVIAENQKGHPINFWALETLRRAKRVMDQEGMIIPSAHLMELIEDPAKADAGDISGILRQLKKEFAIPAFVFSGLISTQEEALSWAILLSRVASLVQDDGIRILYHNHDAEFQGGQPGDHLELFLTTASQVDLQMDTGWVGVATDELEVFERFKDRIGALHLKDEYPEFLRSGYDRTSIPSEAFSPIGSGGIRHDRILSRLSELPRFKGSLVIDQDASRQDMMEELRKGLSYIRKQIAK